MNTLSGFVDQIIFANADNGYTVFVLSTDDGDITCVGSFRYLDEGECIEVKGEYSIHQVYGMQFNVKEHCIKKPDDIASIERYLASGAIKGIGPAMAKRIIKEFGEDTFRVLEEEPERLVIVKGISENKAREIAISVNERRDFRRVMVFLQDYGIGLNLANKIFDRYGLNTLEILRENPYILADEISDVGFKTVDEIAYKIGINYDSDYRVRCGILYCLQMSVSEGHTYLPKENLIDRAKELLGVVADLIEVNLMNLVVDKKLVVKSENDEDKVYPAAFYYMEMSAARKLIDLSVRLDDSVIGSSDEIDRISKKLNIELDELQKEAVEKAMTYGVVIITGGPGTGKTTIINTIIKLFESRSYDFYLAAPTGRAAKRMTETTGYEASTIQRMLQVIPSLESGDRGFVYEKNEDNPLEADAVIIDEMSMVDITLFNSLLKAVSLGTRLILVGDTNQLASVGPGAVLKDIISSDAFPVVRLKKIFRQSYTSDIVLNAHKINRGEHISFDNKSDDFFYSKGDEASNIVNKILYYISDEHLPKFVGAKPFDIQVLTPMKKGSLGVSQLNPVLQEFLNPKSPYKAEKEYGDTVFRVGDKVMQTKNNYNLEWEIRSKNDILMDSGMGVFNGDMGTITDIDSRAETITVEFDEKRTVNYAYSLLDEIELAYAVTIHKSQGSEYPAVVIPVLSGPKLLFTRNLLYTGVTRAKKAVLLIGSKEQINAMIDNADEQKRYTSLSDRITEIVSVQSDPA